MQHFWSAISKNGLKAFYNFHISTKTTVSYEVYWNTHAFTAPQTIISKTWWWPPKKLNTLHPKESPPKPPSLIFFFIVCMEHKKQKSCPCKNSLSSRWITNQLIFSRQKVLTTQSKYWCKKQSKNNNKTLLHSVIHGPWLNLLLNIPAKFSTLTKGDTKQQLSMHIYILTWWNQLWDQQWNPTEKEQKESIINMHIATARCTPSRINAFYKQHQIWQIASPAYSVT